MSIKQHLQAFKAKAVKEVTARGQIIARPKWQASPILDAYDRPGKQDAFKGLPNESAYFLHRPLESER